MDDPHYHIRNEQFMNAFQAHYDFVDSLDEMFLAQGWTKHSNENLNIYIGNLGTFVINPHYENRGKQYFLSIQELDMELAEQLLGDMFPRYGWEIAAGLVQGERPRHVLAELDQIRETQITDYGILLEDEALIEIGFYQ